MKKILDRKLAAYVIGVALGDGNLSNPNGRAVRLRISCDTKYPFLLEHIKKSVQQLMPKNKVGFVKTPRRCVDISCYSNLWESILGWKAKEGSKYIQRVKIPEWIKRSRTCIKECLRGLMQTDGSLYHDRGYLMVNFTSSIPSLANDTFSLIQKLGYKPNMQIFAYTYKKTKYTIRVSKDSRRFVQEIELWKN